MADLAFVKTIAVHESGHCCLAVRLGLGLDSAEVHWRTETASVGRMVYDMLTSRRFDAGNELLGSKIQVALAGPLAEKMYARGVGVVNPADFDWESTDGDVSVARSAAERLTDCKEDRDDLLRRSSAACYSNLLTAWPGVLALAGFLFSHQYANAKTINSFFRKQT